METVDLCSQIVRPYRGKILMYELCGYASILLGLLIIISIGLGLGADPNANWGTLVIWVLIYLVMVPVILKTSKCFANKYLRQAHFALAVVCRAENNRYYLKHGVEIRPGYLASWLEFSVV